MARKARFLGLLATYRELTARERETVDRALEDDPRAREELRRFDRQDALLGSLPAPRLSPAVTDRIMAATVDSRERGLFRMRRPVFAATLALLFMMLAGGTGMASSASLPGDTLYPLKRAIEDTRMALTMRDQARVRYAEQLGQERSEEVHALLGLGREGVAVEFIGPLEQSPTGEWSVAGIPVYLPEGPEAPRAGQPVHVVGETGQARVRVMTMLPAATPDSPARGSEPNEGDQGDEAPGPDHTPGVPQGKGPTGAGAQPNPARDTETPSAPANTRTPERTANPAGEPDDDDATRAPSCTPPGQDKRNTPVPTDDTDDGNGPNGNVTPGKPTAVAPTATPPGGANKDADGHPNPTRRPTQANPSDSGGSDIEGATAEVKPTKEATPDRSPMESTPANSVPGEEKRPTKRPTKP